MVEGRRCSSQLPEAEVGRREVRSYHKEEMLRNPEDPVLSDPHRITDLWDWY